MEDFVTLTQLIEEKKASIQALKSAINKHGIYTFDQVDLLVKADDDDLKTVDDLLAQQHEYEKKFGAYLRRTGTPLSPLELCQEPPSSDEEAEDWSNPYDRFGWPKIVLPDFDSAQQTPDKPGTKPKGHLNHDEEWQARANEIAAELMKAKSNFKPTKDRVAKELAKKLDMNVDTVLRRIRSKGQW